MSDCQHKRYTYDEHEQSGRCIDCGAEGRMRFVVGDPVATESSACAESANSTDGLYLGERTVFERWLRSNHRDSASFERDEFNDGRYKSLDVRIAWSAWRERARLRRSGRFAGWFSELKSGMSYRLWEQGDHEPDGEDVALYEA